MTFTPKPGCPMCGIVDAGSHSQINSPSFNHTLQTNKPDVLWKDDNFTVYREMVNPVSSIAHIIIAFKSVCWFYRKFTVVDYSLSLAASTFRLSTNW
jgi:hypothetical protein